MGTFVVKLTDGSEMILTAGRATRTDAGDVAFENVDDRGNWSRACTVKADRLDQRPRTHDRRGRHRALGTAKRLGPVVGVLKDAAAHVCAASDRRNTLGRRGIGCSG
ncbi:hypothetical protein ABT063_41700 [Streptomyces sp. NPDC002838]|uniref:hypothetical protein n=1 Tax=Streptomyces sp. NPDC002838 TaxID=3154436 RepID=UPI0033262788